MDVHAWPISIGRALDNHIVLDDPHVAAHHARLVLDKQDQLTFEVQDTRNGVQIDGQRVPRERSQALPAAGALLQVGATLLRLRLPAEVLPPEKLLPGFSAVTNRVALTAGALMLALEFGGHWLGLDPGADYSTWVPIVIGFPAAVICWCAMWALLSKLFRHRFDFMGHVRIALPWLLGLSLISSLWPLFTSALDLPGLWHWSGPLQAIGLALLVRAHLGHALPMHPRAVTAAVAFCALAAGGISLAGIYRSSDSLHNAPYMSTLPMPALRWAGTTPSASLVQDMAPLARTLAERAKTARDDDRDDSGSAAEED